MKLHYRTGEAGGEGARGWGSSASGPLLLSPTALFPPQHQQLGLSACEPIHKHSGAKTLEDWQAMTKPLGISDRCRGSRPCGQEEDTEKGGTTSAYLGIHGDSPESGQGLECSGGKKRNLGNQISRFKATLLIFLTLTSKLRLSSPWLKTVWVGYLSVPQSTQL